MSGPSLIAIELWYREVAVSNRGSGSNLLSPLLRLMVMDSVVSSRLGVWSFVNWH